MINEKENPRCIDCFYFEPDGVICARSLLAVDADGECCGDYLDYMEFSRMVRERSGAV